MKTRKEKQACVKENSKKRCKVVAERFKTAEAYRKLGLSKQQIAQEIREQEKENAQLMEEELAKELAEKKDLILQLKVCMLDYHKCQLRRPLDRESFRKLPKPRSMRAPSFL